MSAPFSIDLYFVPMVSVGLAGDVPGSTATGQQVQMVALLLTDAASFAQVKKALLYWVASGFQTGAAMDTAQLDTQAVPALARPAQKGWLTPDGSGKLLAAFVENNLSFTLHPPGQTQADSDPFPTPFPMLPYLALSAGADSTHLTQVTDFAAPNASGYYLQVLTNYFAQLAVSAGPDVANTFAQLTGGSGMSPAAGSSTTPNESMAAVVLADYLNILLRQVVSDAAQVSPTPATMQALVQAMAASGAFASAAGMAARFLFHGLRLPGPATAIDIYDANKNLDPFGRGFAQQPTYPLFNLIGQQWKLPAGTVPQGATQPTWDGYTVGLARSTAAGTLPPISLGTWTGTATIADLQAVAGTGREGSALINDYQGVLGTPPSDGLGPKVVSLAEFTRYQMGPMRFPLGTPAGAQIAGFPAYPGGSGPPYLLTRLSPALRAQVQKAAGTASPPPAADLRIGVAPLTPVAGSGAAPSTTPAYPDSFGWTTRVDVKLRPAVDPGGQGQIIPAVYEVQSVEADDSDDLLGLIAYLRAQPAGVRVDLLYTQNGSFLTDASATLLLVKANLSTTVPVPQGTVLSAQAPQDQLPFLQLLWESSTVSTGGYYLFYYAAANQGLPPALFSGGSASATATVSFLFTLGISATATRTGLFPFQNAALLTQSVTLDNAVLVAEPRSAANAAWQVRYATLPPGRAGFRLRCQNPDASGLKTSDFTRYRLQTMFHLLGNWVEQTPAFAESAEGLPAGPADSFANPDDPSSSTTTSIAGNDWVFQRVLSVAPLSTASDAAARGPYAGVGGTLKLGFQWHDLFGNRVYADGDARLPGPLSIDIGYRDPLLPISQWPGASVSWAPAGTATLQIRIAVDPSRYDPSDSRSAGRAKSDAVIYRQIGYQLAPAEVNVFLTTTLDGEVAHALDQTDLMDFVTRAQKYAADTAAGVANPAVPPPRLWTVAIDPSATPKDAIGLLRVQTVFSRTQHVDPAFTAVPGVAQALSQAKPLLPRDATGRLDLLAFAQSFESAFPQLKLATGADSDSGKLYAVRFQQAGLTLQGTPHYFAPPPLSTAPWGATNVPIQPYQSGQLGAAQPTSFRGADLDGWARGFLSAMDRLLSPSHAVAFARLDSGSYQTVLKAKQKLATAISGTVTEVLAGPSGDRQAAIATLYERLLVSLSEAYLVDCIVQCPVTVSSVFSTAPRLFLQPQADPAQAQVPGLRFSTAELALGSGAQSLTFTLHTPADTDYSHLPLSLSFQGSLLEYNFSTLDWVSGYERSDFLRLAVQVDTSGSKVAVDAPLPERAYPHLPVVDDQSITPVVPASTTLPHVALADIRAYTYALRYSFARTAQDRMYAAVAYNTLAGSAAPATTPAGRGAADLAQALAQYATIAPLLEQDLEALARLQPADVVSQQSPVRAALATFAAQADAIATLWGTWTAPAGSFQSVRALKAITPANLPPPTGGGPPVLSQFTYSEKLDLIAQQSAWGSVVITRNEDLVPGKTVQGGFIYQTPQVSFYSAAIPLVIYNAPFDMSGLSDLGTTLQGRIASFLARLLGIAPGSPAAGVPPVRIAASFASVIAGDPLTFDPAAGLLSVVPVTTSLVQQVDPASDLIAGLCADLARTLTAWQQQRLPAAHPGDRWIFDVSIYHSKGATATDLPPLLQMGNVQLMLAAVTAGP